MVPVIPWYLTLVVTTTSVILAVAVWRILAAGASRPVRIGLAIVLAGWLGAAFLLAPAPQSLLARDRFYITPLIPIFAAASFLIAGVAVWRSSAVRHALATASLPALVGVQAFRTLGLVFVILAGLGQVPNHFGFPAGWGDVAIGVTAPLVALALLRAPAGARTLAIVWSVLGLLDLAVAVGMGTGVLAPYLAPSLGARVPPAAAMGVYPLILVPTFAVPLSVLLHLLALGRLWREARHGPGLVLGEAR
jgi:hypothetical protein